jgi:hypothetical protein
MIRRIRILDDRIRYALDKKMVRKLGWKDNDEVIPVIFGLQRVMLVNKDLNSRLKGTLDYVNEGFLKDIGTGEYERQKEFMKIEKKYGKKSSTAKKIALSKFNIGFLTEEEVKGKTKIPLSKLSKKFKSMLDTRSVINKEIRKLRKEIKSRKKSSS